LKEGLVDPPLDMLYGEELVKIFVSQHDFQRLLAKHEVKDEPVPPHDPVPPPKRMSEADARRKFDEWRESRGDNIPSGKEDVAHMKQHGVSRDRVRELRKRPEVKKRPSSNARRE
jgi:hypothetical protein